MLVRELMSSPVVTVGEDATLATAVGRMLEHDVGSIVVVTQDADGAAPAGIVTATDVLEASHRRDAPLSACSVDAAASSPLATVEPDRTVGSAVDRMIEADVKHLPVVDGLDVDGIVTLTDVAVHYDDARTEAMALVEGRRDWAADDRR